MPRDPKWEYWLGLNEVQFPKELRLGRDHVLGLALHASMKCSSRKNCDTATDGQVVVWHEPQ